MEAAPSDALLFAAAQAGTPPVNEVTQDIFLPADRAAQIDASSYGLQAIWALKNDSDYNSNQMEFAFLDAANALIPNKTVISPPFNSPGVWREVSTYADVPAGARKLRLKIRGIQGSFTVGSLWFSGLTLQMVARDIASSTTEVLTSVDGPLAGTGDKVTYGYNTKGELTSVTNEVGHVTQVTALTANSLPATIVDANSVTTNLTYDARDRLKTVTVNPGAAQALTTIDYDAVGQVTKITRPDGSFLQYTWNDARRVTTVTNNTGETITYGYNLNGDVTSTTVKSAGGTITRQMSMVYDELGRLMKTIGAATQTTTFSYDRTDLLTQVKERTRAPTCSGLPMTACNG